jgi:hypothetical protein
VGRNGQKEETFSATHVSRYLLYFWSTGRYPQSNIIDLGALGLHLLDRSFILFDPPPIEGVLELVNSSKRKAGADSPVLGRGWLVTLAF